MTVQEYLKQGYQAEKRMELKLEQIEKLEALATKCTQVLSDMPRGGGGTNMTDAVVAIVDLKTEIANDVETIAKTKKNILAIINSVGNVRERMVLDMRYVQGYMFEEIAYELDCTEQTVFNLHNRALDKLQDVV